MTRAIHALAGFAFAAAIATSAAAQRASDSVAKLPTVSVTATRNSAAILTTPLAVTKIASGALRSMSGFGLNDALAGVPGVLAQSRYGTSDVRIVIRGFGARGAGDRSNAGTSRGVRFLVDGIPETEPDGRTSFDQIDLATASAVEVIRSNASAVWGNASGGVVNVLTPAWSDHAVNEAQPMFGSFGLQRVALRNSMPVGSNGTAYVNFTNTTWGGYRAHSDARRAVVNAGVVGNVNDKTRVGLYASAANNLFRLPGALTPAQYEADPEQANATYVTRDERRYNRVGRLGVTVDHAVSDNASISSMLFVSPKFLERSERNTFRDFTRYHIGGNVIGRLNIAGTKATVGLDEAYQDGAILFYSLLNGERGTTLADNKSEGANNYGFFAQDEFNVGSKLTLSLGARYDRVSYYNKSFVDTSIHGSKAFDNVTPKIGATWKLGATRAVYANIGGGIEVPAGNEVDPFASQGKVAINPLLDPIRSTTLEAGYKSLGASVGSFAFTYDVALYSTSIKNELQPYNEGRFYMSAGKSRRTGVELGVTAESKTGVFGSLALTASSNKYLDYTVDSSIFRAGAGTGVFDDNKIVGVPGMIAQFELGTEIPGIRGVRVKAGVEHVGEYFADDANALAVPAYTIVNFTAELKKPIVTSNGWGLRGFLTVHNITDKKYVGSAYLNPIYVDGAPQVYEPGMPRAVTLSLSLGRLQ